jgi:hypothetical protein
MEALADRVAEIMERVESGGCVNAALDHAGDCANAVGLPGISIPGAHDGPDDTVDAFGKPNGWCWYCWLQHREREALRKVAALENESASESMGRQKAELDAANAGARETLLIDTLRDVRGMVMHRMDPETIVKRISALIPSRGTRAEKFLQIISRSGDHIHTLEYFLQGESTCECDHETGSAPCLQCAMQSMARDVLAVLKEIRGLLL